MTEKTDFRKKIAARFKRDCRKEEAVQKQYRDIAFAKEVYYALREYLGITESIRGLFFRMENPLFDIPDTYRGAGGEAVAVVQEMLKTDVFLRGNYQDTKTWKGFLRAIDTWEKAGIVFKIGRDVWIISNVGPSRHTVGAARILIPAAKTGRNAHVLPVTTYLQEMQDV